MDKAVGGLPHQFDDLESALAEVIAANGAALALNARRLRGLLNDLLGESARRFHLQVNLLSTASEAGICAELIQLGIVNPPRLRQLANLLVDERGLSPENASWTVDTWASVLCRRIEPAPAPISGATQNNAAPAVSLPEAQGYIRFLGLHRDFRIATITFLCLAILVLAPTLGLFSRESTPSTKEGGAGEGQKFDIEVASEELSNPTPSPSAPTSEGGVAEETTTGTRRSGSLEPRSQPGASTSPTTVVLPNFDQSPVPPGFPFGPGEEAQIGRSEPVQPLETVNP